MLMQQCVCKMCAVLLAVLCAAGCREAKGGVGGEGLAEAQACVGPDQTGKGGAEYTHIRIHIPSMDLASVYKCTYVRLYMHNTYLLMGKVIHTYVSTLCFVSLSRSTGRV